MKELNEALMRNKHEHLADARHFPDTLFADRQILAAEVERLQTKLSHRRCHDCGHVDYYPGDTLPGCRCVNCESADTRLIREAPDTGQKGR